jgi:mannose-6-phosphate isomerase-like protein (cupin superfamily)
MLHRILCAITILLAICSETQASEIHRVVTTLDANNRSTTLIDRVETLSVAKSGNAGFLLWATNSSPAGFSFNGDAAQKDPGINPPDNGTLFRVVEFAPLDAAAEAKLPKNLMMNLVGNHAPARGVPVSHPLMHRTRTVDYAIIMSGEIDMMLDDKTVHLKAGDVVVQQATNHAWINHGKETCRVLFVLMDAKQP